MPNLFETRVRRLTVDCAACSGLCCVALYCRKADGFPADKAADIPCRHLAPDFRCAIHPRLADLGMKGCLAYDCFGAGQQATRLCQPHGDWRAHPEGAQPLFQTFSVLFQLHQMLCYLLDAAAACPDEDLSPALEELMAEQEGVALRGSGALLAMDLADYRTRVNRVLQAACRRLSPTPAGGGDFLGRNFRRASLDGRDFSMALLIGANLEGCSLAGASFLGADLRDANVKNTDLSACHFLTQMQVNAARGNGATRLPPRLSRPTTWSHHGA